ncbi:MAG: methylated-DNA--[protein]-cysteine S-methyltransferase [Oscillospiraceae bacterium]|jgi:methylated-DNA-[protein]-cysteine S-methyltransferase|nr:methylated-DNA--[protein]-cysteine S-methyltransferase [Oscillospiraceae bacterium]
MNTVLFTAAPFGKIGIVSNGEAITRVLFSAAALPENCLLGKKNALLLDAEAQLQEYFHGERKRFSVPLFYEGTDFQQVVWSALRNIPYGTTCSYSDLAKAIGNEKAMRAVGLANNKNPLPIFIPCHRVIGKNGSLTGYAGGLDVKKYLLNIEK